MARLRNLSGKPLPILDPVSGIHAHVEPGEEFVCDSEALKKSAMVQDLLARGLLVLVSGEQPLSLPKDSYWLGVREYLFWLFFFGSVSSLLAAVFSSSGYYGELFWALTPLVSGFAPSIYCLRYFDRKRYPKALMATWIIPFIPFLLVGGCFVLFLGIMGAFG
ncbi:MAG TPA: hypothetical protein DCM05_03335 [Elusimicrobia bacterium]|nr:hypothetical protein [Elusimicrobiota bacterium]